MLKLRYWLPGGIIGVWIGSYVLPIYMLMIYLMGSRENGAGLDSTKVEMIGSMIKLYYRPFDLLSWLPIPEVSQMTHPTGWIIQTSIEAIIIYGLLGIIVWFLLSYVVVRSIIKFIKYTYKKFHT